MHPGVAAALVIVVWSTLAIAPAARAVTFTDVTATALPGLATSPGAEAVDPKYSGGGAVGDCDGDGLPDLYFTGSGHDVLYRNRGDGTFEDYSVAASLGETRAVRGAAFGDVDNDGDLDLFVTGWSDARHFLYVNDGHCRFSEEATQRNVAGGGKAIGRSPSFGDYDRDGWLDLYVSELQSDAINPAVPGPIGHLFHNRGATGPGIFDDVTARTGVALDGVIGPQGGTFPFTARFSDLDGDGWPDFFVTSDFHETRLFWNDGIGAFADGTDVAGAGTDEHGRGAVTADFDGDGRLDLFVASIFANGLANATGNRLLRNDGSRRFTDVTDAAGVRDASWGWGTQAVDVDNDGDVDLIVTNGASDDEGFRNYTQADLAGIDLVPFVTDPVRLWQNDGSGVFTDVAAASGLVDDGIGQGVLAFDYDGDGDEDVVLLHEPAPPRLMRNDGGNAQHWIDVALEGVRAQRNGVGAVVTVTPARKARPLVAEVSASSTYIAQNGTGVLHFGLGGQTDKVRSVQVRWPSGRTQTVKKLAVDRPHVITEETACRGKARKQDVFCVKAQAERKCIVAMNDGGARVAVATGKRLVECVGRPGGSAQACIASDPKGAIAAARAKAAALAEKRCPQEPSFGPTSADVVADASGKLVRLQDVFGPSLDTALIPAATDRKTAACQLAVARGLTQLGLAKLLAFNRCKARGLRRGEIASATTLASCYGATTDEPIVALARRSGKRAARKCGGTSIATAFPGQCAGSAASELFGCVEQQSTCGACLALNSADGLGQGCHQFIDGVATAYCGDRPERTHSIAHEWDEALLSAIRLDTPRPTVHARNLFHLAALMWDVWRAYGGGGKAWLTDESHASDDPARDRETAISFAAYRLLAHRFLAGPGRNATQAQVRDLMYRLGYDATYTNTDGNTPAAVGNRMAAAMIAYGMTDGSNEQGNYADPDYKPVNVPLVVKQPGTTMADPNRWQPLALDLIITQNGIPLPGNVQVAIGTRWRKVKAFALPPPAVPGDVYVDPGPQPLLGDFTLASDPGGLTGDAGYKEGARRVIELSSYLTPTDGATIDISPGAYGNNPLGTNDGTGHPVNPITGQPYPPQVVPRGDFWRVLAEFWADGPQSETPPGHWNMLANQVSDRMTAHRIGGVGPDLDRLEWDVKLYLALNGSVHDAAIVSWGLKGKYDSVRPISMIRYMGGKGQSSDPMGPSYSPEGLPLQPGLIEVITAETTAPGQRHAALAGHEGEIALFNYPGPPTVTSDPAGVTWIRAVEWTSYQKRTFVTPAFPGYTSGHSTFSRAAAEVMTLFTGSPYFPDGLGEFLAKKDEYLTFERGPSVDVRLQWGTYYDAADQAGQSRPAGGIHVYPDDFNGRILGSAAGIGAFNEALEYFAGE
jgi:hypothetical protein